MELKPRDLLVLLKVVAHPQQRWTYAALGEQRDQLVFVGGAVARLLITDPLAERVRASAPSNRRVTFLWHTDKERLYE